MALKFDVELAEHEEEVEQNRGFQWFIATEYTPAQEQMRDQVLVDRADEAVRVKLLCDQLLKVKQQDDKNEIITRVTNVAARQKEMQKLERETRAAVVAELRRGVAASKQTARQVVSFILLYLIMLYMLLLLTKNLFIYFRKKLLDF